MSGKQQKIQLELAFAVAPRGEAPRKTREGTEPRMAESEPKTTDEPPCTDPYARSCGRGRAARPSPIPIRRYAVGPLTSALALAACRPPLWLPRSRSG